MTTNGKPKFDLGQLLSTPGALEALEDSNQTPADFISRHALGDWGEELCQEDKRQNAQGREAVGNNRGGGRRWASGGHNLPLAFRVLIVSRRTPTGLVERRHPPARKRTPPSTERQR
jgi:hypothetical protein